MNNSSNDWNSPWMDHTMWILGHLESLHLSHLEALTLLMIEYLNKAQIPVSHDILCEKLGITTAQAEQTLGDLSDKGFLDFAMENGKVRFLTQGVYDRGLSVGQPLARSLIQEFEDAFARTLSSQEMQCIIDMAAAYGEDRVLLALDEAIAYGHPDTNYIERILASWQQKGLSTEDLRKGYRNERR
ncbi:DnaD domain-containing protein [Faecalibaculum rodentium]|uniref:DnaD domain-containing protein n=1 Tax=Faecalibaculum rodentium TaxID=1702221 RepID=UPI001C3D6CC5|nr:DnaD domain protein [Faecalibaculum rodentium]